MILVIFVICFALHYYTLEIMRTARAIGKSAGILLPGDLWMHIVPPYVKWLSPVTLIQLAIALYIAIFRSNPIEIFFALAVQLIPFVVSIPAEFILRPIFLNIKEIEKHEPSFGAILMNAFENWYAFRKRV